MCRTVLNASPVTSDDELSHKVLRCISFTMSFLFIKGEDTIYVQTMRKLESVSGKIPVFAKSLQ